jgi:phage terminase large subunit-like protein
VKDEYFNKGIQYCKDVIAGRILACKQVHQACQRHLDDLDNESEDFEYIFDIEKAEKVCKFVEKLPHVDGRQFIGKRFKLEPWQCFLLTCLFGWVWKDTGYRRFTQAFISVPRKNGKSFLAAAICLYMLCADQEPGAQIFCAANNLNQALEVFNPAKRMIDALPALQVAFDIEVMKHSLSVPNGSTLRPVVGQSRDGKNAHLAVLDEYHEADSDEVYYSLLQSMGARTQPLMLITTTSGYTLEGPCHRLQKDCEEMLRGEADRPELFALIYTLDTSVDWKTEEALKMANPNYGVSVDPRKLRLEQKTAISKTNQQNPFKTKKLNIWCNAASAHFNMVEWSALSDKKLKVEDFKGVDCWMSADYSSKLDLTCIMKLFKKDSHYYCFPRFYLPETTINDPTNNRMLRWAEQGYLTSLPGNIIDVDLVVADIVKDVETYKPLEFCFDDWNALLFTNSVGKQCKDLKMFSMLQNFKTLSPPMLELDALIVDKRIHHPDNPILNWNMANVMALPDNHDNIKPVKDSKRSANKIDGAVALMLALNRAMLVKEPVVQPFRMFFA